MEVIITRKYKSEILSSILLCLFGLLLIFKSAETIITISYVIGSIIIAMGVLAFIDYLRNKGTNSMGIAYGLIALILGVVIITNPEAIASIIPIIIGVGIIINSAIKLQYSLDLRKIKNSMWKTTLLVSILSTLCGVVILFNPFEGAVIITQIIGAFLVIYAIVDVICAYNINKSVKEINKEFDQIEASIYEGEVIKEKKNKKGKGNKK